MGRSWSPPVVPEVNKLLVFLLPHSCYPVSLSWNSPSPFFLKDSIVLNISNIILLKLFLNGGSALVYMIMIHWFMATVKILLEIKHLFH